MDPNLNELRRQRELIRSHLEWLDQRITQAEAAESKATPPDTQHPAPKKAHPTPEEKDPLPTPATGGAERDLRRLRSGCLALFILAVSLFLFLLFGLPYLL